VVKNSRKALCSGAYKPVNTPEPVPVKGDPAGFPAQVGLPKWQTIAEIVDRWRIDDEWWRGQPVSRLYFKVRLDSGQRLIIYRDLISDIWYQQLY
jgi:hypothetical protein